MKFILLAVFLGAAWTLNAGATGWDFTRPGDFLGWQLESYADGRVADGALSGTTICVPGVASPFLISPPLDLDATADNLLRLRVRSDKSGTGKLYFRESGGSFDDVKSAQLSLIGDGEWHTYMLDFSANPAWSGRIEQVKICLLHENNAAVAVAEIRFSHREPGLIANRRFEWKHPDGTPENWQLTNAVVRDGKAIWDTALPLRLLPDDIYLDFLTPGRKYGLGFEAQSDRAASVTVRLRQFDSFERLLAEDACTFPLDAAPDAVTYRRDDLEVRPNAMKVTLSVTGDAVGAGSVALSDFHFGELPEPGHAGWQAQWIQPGTPESTLDTMYFRCRFTLPAVPELGRLAITADNVLEAVYLNGRALPLGRNAALYHDCDVLDATPYLQTGDNVLAVFARNHDGPGGLLAEARIVCADGSIVTVASSDRFRAATRADNDWEQPGFDDGRWATAYSHEVPEKSLWGEMAYPDLTGPLAAPEKASIYPLPDAGQPVEARLAFKGQTPYLNLNGIPHEIMHHWTGGTGRLTEERLGNCPKNDLHLYWGSSFANWGWRPDGNFDFRGLDDFCTRLLEVDPEAKVVLMLAVDSFHNPEMRSWNKLHPEELVADENGNTRFVFHFEPDASAPSWASKLWLEDQKNNLRRIIRHVDASPYAGRVVGYMPVSGMGLEWVYWGGHDGGGGPGKLYLDYSKPFQQGFREWVMRHYGSLTAVNAAYHDNYPDQAAIPLPTVAERTAAADYFGFIDPAKHQRLIDFRRYFSELTAEVILALAQVVKEETQGTKLFGTFYGYTHNTADPGWCESGHFALERVLESPEVDFLTHLTRYDNRAAGRESGFMTPESSFLLHGKAPVVQWDMRTHRTPPESNEAAYSRCRDLRESLAVLKRDFSNALISGVAFEYGYFGNAWDTGDARIMEVMARCRDIDNATREAGVLKMDPATSVAVITDERSTWYTMQSSPLHLQLVNTQLPAFNHTGSGVDTFLAGDLERMPAYSCYVFLNVFALTPEQETFIETHLKRNGNTLVWIYAPGIVDGARLNPERVSRITGFDFEILEREFTPVVQITDAGHPFTRHSVENSRYSSTGTIGPFFSPASGRVLGIHPESGKAALAVMDFGSWRSVYSAFPGLSPELLQGIAENSGVHVANRNTLDATYLSDRLLAIHSAPGGKRTLYAPPAYRQKAVELFTGREYELNPDGSFAVELAPISTNLFQFE